LTTHHLYSPANKLTCNNRLHQQAVAVFTAVLVQQKVAAATDMVAAMVPPDSAPAAAWHINFGFILQATMSPARLAPQVHPVEASILEHAQRVLKMPEKMIVTDFVQVAASLLALSHADHLRRRQPPPQSLTSDKDTANTAVEKIPVDKKWAEYPDNLRH
jgi:hypothetical protein